MSNPSLDPENAKPALPVKVLLSTPVRCIAALIRDLRLSNHDRLEVDVNPDEQLLQMCSAVIESENQQ